MCFSQILLLIFWSQLINVQLRKKNINKNKEPLCIICYREFWFLCHKSFKEQNMSP